MARDRLDHRGPVLWPGCGLQISKRDLKTAPDTGAVPAPMGNFVKREGEVVGELRLWHPQDQTSITGGALPW